MTNHLPNDCCSRCKFSKFAAVGAYHCVRFPAQVVVGPQGPTCLFPQMKPEGWCGEFQRKLDIVQ